MGANSVLSRVCHATWILLVLAVLGACQTYTYKIKPTVGSLSVPDTILIRAAILLPQAERTKAFTHTPAHFTGTVNIGEGLVVAALPAYRQVFQETKIISDMVGGKGFDIIIAPSVTDLKFRWRSPGFHIIQLTLNVKGYVAGREAFNETYTSESHGVEGAGHDTYWAVDQAGSKAILDSLGQSVRAFYESKQLTEIVRSLDKVYQEAQRQISNSLEQTNVMYRVVAEGAQVRRLPNADASSLDSYPSGSVVHVIGKLPSGWLRVARDGKPFGWVHEAALQEESGSDGGDGRKYSDKPLIFVAYPKGGEKVAESSIDVIGYINSANRTDRLDVIVNGRPVSLDRLWSRFEVEPSGLRGYPLSWRVPLKPGENKIDINVLDQEGFLVNHAVTVTRIELAETAVAAATSGLPKRLENILVSKRSANVSADNFMEVLGDWVKDTAKTDYNKGNAMFDQGRFARAAYYYRKSVKTDPLGQAWYNLGISEKAIGNKTEANDAFATACRMEIPQACDVES